MNKILILIILLIGFSVSAQRVDQQIHSNTDLSCRNGAMHQMIDDETYDVKHYHIDVEISISTEYIQGNVFILADAVE
ncbi:MAG: hypothetical protein ABFS12_18640, partial [Bacteroidota bacterium]